MRRHRLDTPSLRLRPIPDHLRTGHAQFFRVHRRDGRYRNPWGTTPDPKLRDVVRWKSKRNPHRERKRGEPVPPRAERPLEGFHALPKKTRLMWIGHASFLVEVDGVRILIDPIFGRAGGIPRVARAPVIPERMPRPDVILITHGHRDHMCGRSIRRVVSRFGPDVLVALPRGLRRHLPGNVRRVVELEWWQHFDVRDVSFTLVPAQHWHHRHLVDRNRALWGGWVIEGSRTVYHSGDTGYFGGFEAIGRVFGGVDVACLPLGAYEPEWFLSEQHMSPEDSLRAWMDLDATHFVGMHWGTYDLSDEPLSAGPEVLGDLIHDHGLDDERFHVLHHGGSLGMLRDDCVAARGRSDW
ncbi:MAG: MBL fold metallo-hydrolase [Myxococcota bacterium]